MAHGLCDDLASTVILAADKPILAAPAMNWRMWEHPATKRNLNQLKADGVHTVGPNEGGMACGEWGMGRMAEVPEIIEAADAILRGGGKPLAGKRVLVTAGPTYEPIDPVRFIGNRSSGKQGYAIASAAARLGAEVTLIAGPGALPDPSGVKTIHIETAREMLEAVEAALPVDIAVFSAAVADWRPDKVPKAKIKKGANAPQLALVENPDILKSIARHHTLRPKLVIGFAAETENVLDHAQKKRTAKGCDWIVANDVSPARGTFGGDRNTVHLIGSETMEHWPEMTKDQVAARLMEEAANHLNAGRLGQPQERQPKP
jgi:phosphopantothenoylcysteine decarboxylase/phosphopantothenate--cysteine ligase